MRCPTVVKRAGRAFLRHSDSIEVWADSISDGWVNLVDEVAVRQMHICGRNQNYGRGDSKSISEESEEWKHTPLWNIQVVRELEFDDCKQTNHDIDFVVEPEGIELLVAESVRIWKTTSGDFERDSRHIQFTVLFAQWYTVADNRMEECRTSETDGWSEKSDLHWPEGLVVYQRCGVHVAQLYGVRGRHKLVKLLQRASETGDS